MIKVELKKDLLKQITEYKARLRGFIFTTTYTLAPSSGELRSQPEHCWIPRSSMAV